MQSLLEESNSIQNTYLCLGWSVFPKRFGALLGQFLRQWPDCPQARQMSDGFGILVNFVFDWPYGCLPPMADVLGMEMGEAAPRKGC